MKLPNILFAATLAFAIGLGLTVIASPYLLGNQADAPDLLMLFARDMTVRRTAFFSAVGLGATAFIFFRPPTLAKKKGASAPAASA